MAVKIGGSWILASYRHFPDTVGPRDIEAKKIWG
jgi:hypothetical protein